MGTHDANAMINEQARQLRVSGTYDVVVAGGGVAGVAAAVAAARAGARVCLLERGFGLGGLATLGNVTVWLPICDGRGRQVIGGIGEELLRLSVRDLVSDNKEAGFFNFPACWEPGGDPQERQTKRFRAGFNPASYMLALEEWLLAAGVKLIYDTLLCAVIREGSVVSHVIVENKSGRSALACKAVVDATGEADVAFLAGERCESVDSNVAAGWFYYIVDGKIHIKKATEKYSANLDKNELSTPSFRGDDAEQVTAQMLASRELIRREMAVLREQREDKDVEPCALPTLPGFRATRRLVGRVSLSEGDNMRKRDDAVCLTGDWRRSGPVFAINLDMLRGIENKNLFVAGRCMSADRSIWDCTRAIPTCAVTGEAAGVAAAFCARLDGYGSDKLSVAELRQYLSDVGNILEF